MAAAIAAVTGKDVRYVPVSDEAAQASMREMDMDERAIDAMDSLNRIIAAGYAAGISPDLHALTDRAPRTFAAFAQKNAAARG